MDQLQLQRKRTLLLLLKAAVAAVKTAEPEASAPKRPCRTSALSGKEWVEELRRGHPARMHENLRMDVKKFDGLVLLLSQTGLLPPPRLVFPPEQVAIFLYIVGSNCSIRNTAERFQHSGETISKCFNGCLKALLSLAPRFLKLPQSDAPIPNEIKNNTKFSPYFDGCLGAFDGTHVDAVVPEAESTPYRSRKSGNLSQNVLAVCSFALMFLFIHAGWEGSAHDGRVLDDALQNGFSIPEGRYYLADAGYSLTTQVLVPYRGVRYHLKEWGQAHERPVNAKELFNLRHAQLRNAIERIFGCLQKRFPILKAMQLYSLETQRDLVIAVAILFNIIRSEYKEDGFDDSPEEVEGGGVSPNVSVGSRDMEAETWRDSIANSMWADYQRLLRNQGRRR